MGVDVSVVMDHHAILAEISQLPDVLDAAWRSGEVPPLPATIDEHLKLRHPKWSWDTRYGKPEDLMCKESIVWLHGPDGWSGTVYPKAVEFMPFLRWRFLLQDADVQRWTITVARIMARALKASRILLLPDSAFLPELAFDLICEGAATTQTELWLVEHAGPAASLHAGLDSNAEPRLWFALDVHP